MLRRLFMCDNMAAAGATPKPKVKWVPWSNGGSFPLPPDVLKRILHAQKQYPGAKMGAFDAAQSGYVAWVEGKREKTLALGVAVVYPLDVGECGDYWGPTEDPMAWSSRGATRNGLPSYH